MSFGHASPDLNRHLATLPGPSGRPTAKWLTFAGRRTPQPHKTFATQIEPPQISSLPTAQI